MGKLLVGAEAVAVRVEEWAKAAVLEQLARSGLQTNITDNTDIGLRTHGPRPHSSSAQ